MLFDLVERLGKPTFVRTDNEAIFKSKRFRWALIAFGVRHQITQVASPWQSGRVERFFGILKGKWAQHAHLPSTWSDLVAELREFRTWYNHLRPHRHLDSFTPARAWAGQWRRRSSESSENVEALDGVLSGFFLPP
ncbi:MAG: integrase core domain-containing protein [Acidobacteriota bacterium]